MKSNKKIPEYYNYMYLDGYTPEEIWISARRKYIQDYKERNADQEKSKELFKIHISSEVKVK